LESVNLVIRDRRYDENHVIRPFSTPEREIDKRLTNIKTFGVPVFCAVKIIFKIKQMCDN
jgi:hypothetical protein